MDDFHKANMKHVTGMDYNANRYVKRGKKDGQMLRQLARTRLKTELKGKLDYHFDISKDWLEEVEGGSDTMKELEDKLLLELQKMNAEKLTENGDEAYSTTGSRLTDLLFMAPYFEKNLNEALIGKTEKEKLFSMYMRDPRFGMGRRDLGRHLMAQADVDPEWIVKVGRYDDLYKMHPKKENFAYLRKMAESDNLAKKWLPRLTGKDRKIAKILCNMWRMTQKEYRALIKTDKTTEYKLSYAEPNETASPLDELFKQNDFKHPLVNEIDFEQVPSMAMNKYLHCFSTREDIKERFHDYITKVRENKAKINTKTSNVHDAYKVATRGASWTTQGVEDEARDLVSSKIVDNATLGIEINAIPILDTSGSMWGRSYGFWGDWGATEINPNDIGAKAMSVAYAIASKSTYAPNQVISFSSHPKLIEIKGDTMQERYKSMYTGDCSNTDFGAVMKLLANLKRFPKYFIVLTDMEFDQGSCYSKEKTMKLIREAGAPTRIIWWNFNDRNKTAPEFDEYGNIYLSGYNIQTLKLLEQDFDMTAYLDKILEKYAKDIDYKAD